MHQIYLITLLLLVKSTLTFFSVLGSFFVIKTLFLPPTIMLVRGRIMPLVMAGMWKSSSRTLQWTREVVQVGPSVVSALKV